MNDDLCDGGMLNDESRNEVYTFSPITRLVRMGEYIR